MDVIRPEIELLEPAVRDVVWVRVRAVWVYEVDAEAFYQALREIEEPDCDLEWWYCPRDPDCEGYTMSSEEVSVVTDIGTQERVKKLTPDEMIRSNVPLGPAPEYKMLPGGYDTKAMTQHGLAKHEKVDEDTARARATFSSPA